MALTAALALSRLMSLLMTMQHLRSNVTYVPVISRPADEPVPWPRAIGHVQDVWHGPVLAQAWGGRPAPQDTHVFLCGSPHMIEGMAALLTDEGFREYTTDSPGQIHVERYWFASPASATEKRKAAPSLQPSH
jgi:ferredoxin/flavodoxin---NADP+ reductase